MICDTIMKFSLIVEEDEDGRYVVECTDLPGCVSEGETLKEAIDNIHGAIIGCLNSIVNYPTLKDGASCFMDNTCITEM